MPPRPPLEPNEPKPRAIEVEDLAWDAFRYVSDAMTPLEAAAFERRLLDDLAACEAVAEAVDSLGAIGLVAREVAGREELASFRMGRRRPRVLAPLGLLATAATVLLAAFWGSGTILRPASIGNAIDVALAWTDLREGSTAVDATPAPGDSSSIEIIGASESSSLDGTFNDVADVPAERPLPSWMVAAVSPKSDDDSRRPEDN